jgi:hypothetical protein
MLMGRPQAALHEQRTTGLCDTDCSKPLLESASVLTGLPCPCRPYLNNPNNAYHMLRTTMAMSNWDGYYIIPRFATGQDPSLCFCDHLC